CGGIEDGAARENGRSPLVWCADGHEGDRVITIHIAVVAQNGEAVVAAVFRDAVQVVNGRWRIVVSSDGHGHGSGGVQAAVADGVDENGRVACHQVFRCVDHGCAISAGAAGGGGGYGR